jgi:CubicO group peptidase (beta-lactamase class C family)
LAVLKLADAGKVNLDAPVKEYLPWFEMKNPAYSGLVTMRQLLNQTSGFERQYGFFDRPVKDQHAYEQKLAGYIRHIEVRFKPGTAFLYSNLNYVLLGLVIQHVSGLSYDAYLSREILPVVGMNHTVLTQAKALESNLIQPYHYLFWGIPVRSKVYDFSDYLVPAGYISSNIHDLAAYMQFMLDKTVSVSGDTLLPESLYRELTGLDKDGYAMGWFHSSGDSISMVSHSGLDENFSSSFTFFPGKDVGYAILCNANSLEFCGLADGAIRGILFNKPYALKGNMEKKMRGAAFFIPIFLLAGFIINLIRWRKWSYGIGMTGKVVPVMRWLLGVVLSIVPLVMLSKMYQLHVKDMIRFSPDIAWGLILIMIIGTLSATIRYLGTAAKIKTRHITEP